MTAVDKQIYTQGNEMIPRQCWLAYTIALGLPIGAAGQAPKQSGLSSVPGAPAGVTAFVDVAVVPMDTERMLSGQTVLVEDGRITALGPVGEIAVPADARLIDGHGKYLMPGLADMHTHVTTFLNEGTTKALEDTLFTTLADGITMIRNLDYIANGFGAGDLLPVRARAAAGEIWSPRIYTSGQWGPSQYLDPKWQDSIGVPLRMDSIEAYLRTYKAAGYDLVKVREETVEVFDSVLVAARRVGIPVAGHSGRGSLGHAVAQGLRSIEHVNMDSVNQTIGIKAAVAALKKAGAWSCICPPSLFILQLNPSLVLALREAGAGLLAGTDGTRFGSIHDVLNALVQMGLTPYEALAMSTTDAARYFVAELNAPDDIGTVAVGKRADLILLTGNPLENVMNTKDPAGVMIGGRWLDRAELDERLAAFQGTP